MKGDAAGSASRILDVAEALAQVRGFNGFSYADIASEVGITKASLHYHFRTKSELGRSLIERYHSTFLAALEAIDEESQGAVARLEAYVALYAGVLRGDRMCLCGMLAAEFSTLPGEMQQEIRAFFDMNERWLSHVLDGGKALGELRFEAPSNEIASDIVGTLEGTMLIARSYGEPARFERAARRLIGELRA